MSATDRYEGLFANYDKVLLEKIRWGIERAISKEAIMNSKVETWEDLVTGGLVVRVSGFIWGETFFDRVVEYPETWWDHTKMEINRKVIGRINKVLPKFFQLGRLGYRMKREEFKSSVLYPEFVLPEEYTGKHVFSHSYRHDSYCSKDEIL